MGKHKMVRQRRTPNQPAGAVRVPPAGPQSPHPQTGTSDPFFIALSAFTMICSYDNFELPLFDSYKLGDQDPFTGAITVFICVPYMVVKSYESMGLPPVRTIFRSWIKIPGFIICPADIRIYRDTAIVVILSYVVLLDISLSYLWLAVFPVVAIVFIYALCSKLCPRAGGHCGGEQQQPDSAAGRSSITGDGSDAKAKSTKGSDDQEALILMAIAAEPFCALLVMAQLPDSTATMFAVSQFMLFLSTTLGALTYMMTRLPASSGDVVPASRLLHRASLLALLATAHAVAAEWLGEHVVLSVLPELAPVLLWFSLHLDCDSSIITVDDIKPRTRAVLIVLGVAVALFAYLGTSMDELGLSICTTIAVSCAVSGLLTSYLVFMLRRWPGCKDDATAASDASEPAATTTTSPHYKKQGSRGKQTTGSLDGASAKQAGSSSEAVRLLMFWAYTLLISAAALLLLQHLVAVRIGLQEPLVDQLAKILNHCADKYLPH